MESGTMPVCLFLYKKYYKELIEDVKGENLIVNGARNQMARLIAGAFTNRDITKIAFGTSGVAPTVDDTALTNAFIKNVTGFAYPAMGQVTISWNLLTSEDNGQAIMEFGLVCADGTLFSRRVRANPIYKESDISIEGQWTIIF
ncbi:MAG: hypothetical protein LBE13_16045 [Bacteroidales bacterium]|nr:hypothetical protein [Bacteroidales bacterium]